MSNLEKSKLGLFARAAKAANDRAPNTAIAVIYTLALFASLALAFSAVTPVRELTRALGTLQPSGGSQQIEHLTGGIVTAVYVEEGQLVQAGQIIAELSAPPVEAELARKEAEIGQAQARLSDLTWVLSNLKNVASENSFLDLQITQTDEQNYAEARLALHWASQAIIKEAAERASGELVALEEAKIAAWQRAELASQRIERLTSLEKSGHVSEFRLMEEQERYEELRSEAMSASVELERVRSRQAEDRARYNEEALKFRESVLREAHDAELEVARLQADVTHLEMQIADLTIRAPQDGVIQSVSFPNAGEVVGSEDTLFDLLPSNDRLVAEIRLNLDDIGHVQVGNNVQIKVSSFDYRMFGGLEGFIHSISPDLVEERDGTQYFRAVVSLDRETVGSGSLERPLHPGMQVSAEIRTGTRTILAYLLKPIESSLLVALSER